LTGSVSVVFFTLLAFENFHGIKPEKDDEREEKGIAAAIDWWYNVRSNQQTGEFDVTAILQAQKEADELSSTRSFGIQWEEMGPDNVGGRTRAILFDKINPGVVFAGGVSGGLWRSTNGGESWFKINDMFDVLTVTCLAQASNGDIYFGTGEALYSIGTNNPTGFSAFGFPGKGIWKSTDGGNTFTHLAATSPLTGNSITEDWAFVSRIAISPDDPNRIYAAMNKGLRVSTDAGITWANATTVVVYAWDVQIGSDAYVHAVINNKYYRSTSPNGSVFELRSGLGGFPTVPLGRIELAVAPSNPAYVYATCVNAGSENLYGVYRSTDAGLNWTLIGPGGSTTFAPLGFQGTYDVCMAVQPTDPDIVYLGGQFSLWKYSSTLSWITLSNWLGEFFDLSLYIHADMHAIVFNPFNPAEVFIGCDGGLFRSANADDLYPTFSNLNRNYNVTQFYSVSATPTGEVIGGTQDNGTQYIDFLGNTIMSSNEIQGGDGGHSEISKLFPNAFFSEFPAGTITRSSSSGGGFNTFYDCKIDFNPAATTGGCGGDGVIDEGADWLTPFDLWEAPDTSRAFFVLGAGPVGGSTGHLWFTAGAMNFGSTPDWFRFPDCDGVVTCVAISNNGNELFAGTDNGTLYHYSNINAVYDSGKFSYPSSSSSATSWKAVDSGVVVTSVSIGSGRYLRWIAVDPTDANKVIVTAARYGAASYIWRSTNALTSTMTFLDVTDNLPKMPVWTALVDAGNPNRVLIGTDLGVYGRDFSSPDQWAEENGGMARVPVMVIKQEPYFGANYLYVGTYGRGIFRSGSLSVGIGETPSVLNNVRIFPNPVQDQAKISMMLAKSSSIDISIYNLSGTLVERIHQDNTHIGENTILVNTSKFNSGAYLVNVKAGVSSFNQKMIVIK
jgi:hypothetical protein